MGAYQKHEPQKKTRNKSSNMSKVVHVWEDPHCQVDHNDDQEGQ